MTGTDAITLLKKDHKEVRGLFRKFEKLAKSEESLGSEETRSLCREILQELSIHTMIEEQFFYPFLREHMQDVRDIVFESFEEHHIVKNSIAEIEKTKKFDEQFKAKVTVLIEMVEHHVDEEEQELFPKVRESLGRKDLIELGNQMLEAREGAMKALQGGEQPRGGIAEQVKQAVEETAKAGQE